MKLGLALGGGGAKGLAHVAMLEALDQLGVRPHVIAGTSVGAIVGALYAAGHSGREINSGIKDLIAREGKLVSRLSDLLLKDALRLLEFVDPNLGQGGLLKGDKFLSYISSHLGAKTFEGLKTPLKVVAADFWKRRQVVLESGELTPAIRASMALPWLFTPVEHQGRLLVDGGTVNPVPYDLLQDQCDLTVAIDVMGTRDEKRGDLPGLSDSLFNTFQIMQKSILAAKMAHRPPDVYIEVELSGIKVLEFYKAAEIHRQGRKAADKLKHELGRLLERA